MNSPVSPLKGGLIIPFQLPDPLLGIIYDTWVRHFDPIDPSTALEFLVSEMVDHIQSRLEVGKRLDKELIVTSIVVHRSTRGKFQTSKYVRRIICSQEPHPDLREYAAFLETKGNFNGPEWDLRHRAFLLPFCEVIPAQYSLEARGIMTELNRIHIREALFRKGACALSEMYHVYKIHKESNFVHRESLPKGMMRLSQVCQVFPRFQNLFWQPRVQEYFSTLLDPSTRRVYT